jgi:hypothetical protein
LYYFTLLTRRQKRVIRAKTIKTEAIFTPTQLISKVWEPAASSLPPFSSAAVRTQLGRSLFH